MLVLVSPGMAVVAGCVGILSSTRPASVVSARASAGIIVASITTKIARTAKLSERSADDVKFDPFLIYLVPDTVLHAVNVALTVSEILKTNPIRLDCFVLA